MELLDAHRHLLRGRDEQRAEADRRRVVLLGGLEDRLDRDLLAEVDDRVAVVREDRVDERLADVVDVAEHGREHDRALRVALELVEVLLELRDRALHDLGALQDERQDELAGAELVADLLHRRQQDLVERRDGADLLDGGVDLVLDAVALAAQDVEVQRLLGLHARGRRLDLLLGLLALGLEVGDEALERVLAAVPDEVVGELALVVGDLAVRRDVVRVDHREVQAGLDAVVQEDRVEDRAGGLRDAEGDVRDAERGLDAGDVGLDAADALDRLDGARPPLLVAGRQREGQAVEDQRLGLEAVLVAGHRLDALRDLHLALGRLGHADLVDRQRDERGAVGQRERGDLVELVAAGLEVDGVDDRAAGDLLEGGLDDVGFGRVDLDGRGLRQGDALDDLAHLVGLVLALGERDADVEHMRAALDLVLGDLHEAVVVVGEQQFLGLARALRVDALADERRARVLHERRGGHHARHLHRAALGARADGVAGAAVDDRLDVLRRRPAAAADDRHAVALDELAEDVRELVGRLGEDRLAVRALERQPGVRDAVDGDARVLAEVADRVAHVLGARRAVQADGVDLERLERGQRARDVRAEEHLAALREQRHRRLDRHGAADALERLAGAEDRRLDLEDVLRRLDDEQVGAALEEALRLLGEDLEELTEGDAPEGRVGRRGQMAGRADRAGDEALLADRLAGDLGRLAVDLERVVGEAPLVELQPAGLERVRLDDLGARLDHRVVDPLDDVGPVQDQRLVALALQAAVVLGGEVELLQGRSHAAVEDDDTAADCLEIVAHGRAMLPTKSANLDKAVATLRNGHEGTGGRDRDPHGVYGGSRSCTQRQPCHGRGTCPVRLGGTVAWRRPREDDATPGRDRGWG